MQATKNKQPLRFSQVLARVGLLVTCASLVFSLITFQVEIVAKRQQYENLVQQVSQQTADNKEVAWVLETEDENAYIERVAREKLGFAKPDERVFVDMSGD